MSRSFAISLVAALALLVSAGSALAGNTARTGIGALGCPQSGKLVTKGITHDKDFENWANAVRAGHTQGVRRMARADYCGNG